NQSVREPHLAPVWRQGADLDVRPDAASHREDAEGREIDRLDAVIDEHTEFHRLAPGPGRSSLITVACSLATLSTNASIWARERKWCTRFDEALSSISRRYFGVRCR